MTTSKSASGLRITALLLRASFIFILIAVTIRVSLPQSSTFWTSYDIPRDLLRLILGVAVCIWLLVQLFRTPKDAPAHRTWIFVGLVAIPVSLICLYAVW